MLFVRTLLLSFVLALSVAAAPIDLEKWAPAELLPGPLTDAENAEFLAEGGGLWTRVSKSQTANVVRFFSSLNYVLVYLTYCTAWF
jgi:hypothetical protein